MSMNSSLLITLVPESSFTSSGDRYWLKIVQPSAEEKADDKVTAEEVASLTDKLYDIDPCLPPDEQIAELTEVTEEKLNQTAADVFGNDLESCRAALSGDYTEHIKIIRSHPDETPPEPYKLELSVGRVTSTSIVREKVTALLAINGQSSIDLEYPVVVNKNTPVAQQGVSFSWVGDIIGSDGLINPPVIERSGNTLYWAGEATGQIKAVYPTIYDSVTVEVPGTATAVEGVGNAQNVKVLAYWHLMVFPGEISAPVTDSTVSKGAMVQLCGQMTTSPYYTPPTDGGGGGGLSGGGSDPEDPPPTDEGEESQYGCQTDDHFPYDDPNYYERVCCDDMPGGINTCPESRVRRPGGVGMSQADIDKYTSEDGKTDFVPCSPDKEEGCGSIIMRMWVPRRNCCEDVVPLEWDHENSVEVISPSSHGTVYILNGKRPVTWKVRGRGFYTNPSLTQREATTIRGQIVIYTSSAACGSCQIDVDDGCSVVVEQIRSSQGQWISINPSECPQRFTAQSAEAPGLVSGSGVYSWFWYTGGKYKVKQKYWVGPGRMDGGFGYSTTFEDACAECEEVSWKSLISQIEADSGFYTDFSVYPELINIANAVHLVPYSSDFHGDDKDPQYGNTIAYQERFFGVEYGKFMTADFLGRPIVETCVGASTASLVTGFTGIGGTPYPAQNECFAWEWTC